MSEFKASKREQNTTVSERKNSAFLQKRKFFKNVYLKVL